MKDGKVMDLDIKLRLNQLIYIFTIGITWGILTFWGDHQLNAYYDVLPQFASIFITISYWLGGIVLGIGIILLIFLIIE